MLDRPLKRPARRFAGAALLLSVILHAGGLSLVLWLVSSQGEKEAPALAANELVVVVEDDPRTGTRGGKDVTLTPVEIAPATMRSTLVDPPALQSPIDTARAPAPQARGPLNQGAVMGDGGDTHFFQVSATGRTVVYVLDRSMSMGEHDGLRQARVELLASLGRLPPTALFQVIPYNQLAEPLCVQNFGGMLHVDAGTLAEVARVVAAIRATGRTNHLQALLRGLEFRPDVLFLATDADGLTADEIAAVARYNGGRCSIHVLDFSTRPDDGGSPLRQLAAQNHGTYRRVPVKEL